jgi:tetratricopeptide (TPR) repeat protein
LFFLLPEAEPRWDLAAVTRRDDAVVGCGPEAVAVLETDADGRYAPVFPGWGHYHYPIGTTSDSAQFYFDQGLSLYYGYHLTESLASFKEAARRDSGCLMAWWGQALAMGPFYNNTYTYRMPAEVLPVLVRMNQLTANAPAREQDLAAVMNRRYSTDVSDSRRSDLNNAYSDGMKELIGKYPDDKDIKALYIDGRMTEHAWDMFDSKWLPRPWTPELIRFCEEILAADAYHPAALHYHIHLLEASRHPEVTLPSADKLHVLMPGVAHMVHMSSHSYQRAGLYTKGVYINDSASDAQVRYEVLARNLKLDSDVIHYHAVEAFCALNGGMYAKALQEANKCRQIASTKRSATNMYLQYLYSMPVFVDVRLGKWKSLLDRPAPDTSWVYASILHEFGRGMAFLRGGDDRAARTCLDSIQKSIRDHPGLTKWVRPTNPPATGALIAAGILQGEIEFVRGRPADAMKTFTKTRSMEDEMIYREPKDWLLPVRQYAGVCLLRLGKAAEAGKLYREDLERNPGNGWGLLGLSQSLTAQRKYAAGEYMDQARKAFADAEVMPAMSAY